MVVLKKWGQEGRQFKLLGRQFILLEKKRTIIQWLHPNIHVKSIVGTGNAVVLSKNVLFVFIYNNPIMTTTS